MPTITVSGTLDEVLKSMENIKAVTKNRKASGWPLFQADEEWTYEVQHDERVCFICLGYAGRMVGSQIPIEFPDYKVWEEAHVKPGTHIYFPFLAWSNAPDAYGGCRCNLYWPDYLFVLVNRLFDEMEMVI